MNPVCFCFFSIAKEHVQIANVSDTLTDIQHRLQDINSILSSRRSDQQFPHLHKLLTDKTLGLENQIDSLTAELEPLRNFIIPSGGLAASHLHFSRAICRRAERSLCHFINEKTEEASLSLGSAEIYLNRLSDYLFTAARYCAKTEGHPETPYSSRTTKQDQ